MINIKVNNEVTNSNSLADYGDMSLKTKSKFVEAITKAYTFDGKSFYLGNAVEDSKVNATKVNIPLATFNRHGLIAGATGTGKTKTLQRILESLSLAGVPSLVLDIKGDVSGIGYPGQINPKVEERSKLLGVEFIPKGYPVEYLSLSGNQGIKVKATVTEFGPVLFSKLLELNETQGSIVSLIFKYCDDNGLLLLDLEDFKKVLQYLSTDGKEDIVSQYGSIASTSMSTIMRKIIDLEGQGAASFFGEVSFDVNDLLKTDNNDNGFINVLRVNDIQGRPKLFSTAMLSLLSEIYESFEELGDVVQPKLCVFIDEAHLLFDESSNALLDKVEQMIKLIRSKGVGIFFITQNPIDIPTSILSQLGLKIQHALRAFTANDNKAIKLASDNFPTTEFYNVPELLTGLGIGEALVTCLDERGNPTALVHTMIAPPQSRMDTITEQELMSKVSASPLSSKYTDINRQSAYEMLTTKMEANIQELKQIELNKVKDKDVDQMQKIEDNSKKSESEKESDSSSWFKSGSILKSIVRSVTVTATGAVMRQIIRGVLGGVSKKK
jgi:uncharacterized protein